MTTNVSLENILMLAGSEAPVRLHKGNNWEYWEATFRGISRSVQEKYLYLHRDCNWVNLGEAASWLRTQEATDTTILVENQEVADRFQKKPASDQQQDVLDRIALKVGSLNFVPLTVLLLRTLQKGLRPSDAERISADALGLQYFVDPSVHMPERPDDQSASDALLTWLTQTSKSEDHVAVVLAPAGTGKTTLSEEIFRRQASTPNSWPLLVTRDQWLHLVNRSDLTLEDIWLAAIADLYPGAVVGRDLVEQCLAVGTIRPVFDGLDELCSSFPGDFDTDATIKDLLSLFSNGRVLLTSRAQFWRENVTPALRKKVREIDLRPFSSEQRTRYLTKRFPEDTAKRERADRILQRLGGKSYAPTDTIRIDTLPYVIMLAAESADTDADEALNKYGNMLSSDDPLEGLLTAFCDRERVRQKRLTVPPATQVQVLELLALEYGFRFSASDLDLVLEYFGVDVREEAFREHSMLSRSGDNYTFRFDFVVEYFLARILSRWVSGENQPGAEKALVACLESGGLIERTVSFIDSHTQGEWTELIRIRWNKFPFPEKDKAKRGFLRLILGLARHRGQPVRKDATEALMSLIGDLHFTSFRRVAVSGTVSGFDFRRVTFVECVFHDVEWAQCSFDEHTIFRQCGFEGRLNLVNCAEFGVATFEDCSFSPSARGAIQSVQGHRRAFPITEEQIGNAVYVGLRKSRAGVAGFKSRKVDGFFRGEMRQVPFAKEVFDALVITGVFREYQSQGESMYAVDLKTEARNFLVNRLATGAVKDTIARLRKKLIPAE